MKCRQVKIKIKAVNDPFANQCRHEIARILRVTADQIEHDVADFPIALIDYNGNNVGKLTIQ